MSPTTMVLVSLLTALVSKVNAASVSETNSWSVLSGIKHIVRDTENEIITAKNEIVKAQEEVVQLKEHLSSSVVDAYNSLLDVLTKVQNLPVNVQETKNKYDQLIKDSTEKINSAIVFYNDNINNIFKQFKDENDIIKNQVDSFLGSVGLSGCIEASNTMGEFEKCIEPVYIKFTVDLSKAVEIIRSASNLLIASAVNFTHNVSKEIDNFRNVKVKIEEEVNKIKLLILNSKSDFIQTKSTEALARVKDLLKNKERIEVARNTVRNMVANIEETQKELRNTIKTYVRFNPEGMLSNIDERVKTAIEKTENIRKNALSDIDEIEITLILMERGTWTMYEKVAEDNVKETCKQASDVIGCVNYAYKTFDENFDYLSRNLLALVSTSNSKLSNLVGKANSDFYTVVADAINYAEYETKMVLKYYKRSIFVGLF